MKKSVGGQTTWWNCSEEELAEAKAAKDKRGRGASRTKRVTQAQRGQVRAMSGRGKEKKDSQEQYPTSIMNC